MDKLRIAVLHDSRPPAKASEPGAEPVIYVEDEVAEALAALGHEPKRVAVNHNLKALIDTIQEFKPGLIFNLTESFMGDNTMEAHIVALLDMLRIPYTGSNPSSLIINNDKGIQKKLLAYHGIMTPEFAIFPVGRSAPVPDTLRFPLIVKPMKEDASIGIHECSIVKNADALVERVKFVHANRGQPALVEEYIEGREFYVSIVGNEKPVAFPIVELDLSGLPDSKPKIASFRVKWNEAYRDKMGIRSVFPTDLKNEVRDKINKVCLSAYKILGVQNYGRIDIRLSPENDVYVLEANPNPYISDGEDFANAAEQAGMNYPALIGRIVELALAKEMPR
ncbi:MAG TPA: ATP-grasp domain-containing protein [bacterium]|nr:ATP-grasp domain-containing protein [bacterium]